MTLEVLHRIALETGLLSYLALLIFCVVNWARGVTGRAALLASFATLGLFASLVILGYGAVSYSLEVISVTGWVILIIRIIGLNRSNWREPGMRLAAALLAATMAVALLSILYVWIFSLSQSRGIDLPLHWLFVGQLLIAVLGLVLLEQVLGNMLEDYRWRMRYLNIGLGTLLVFQLIHNACGLLFAGYVPALLTVQPMVFALVAPFIAIGSLRNADNPLKLNLSRRFVFRGGALLTIGLGLLVMSLAGYFVRLFEGDWVSALLALGSTILVMGVLAVFGSSRVRGWGKRFISENLFASKYDYRDEWRRVTDQLTEPSVDFDLGQQVIRALAGVLDAPGGALWQVSNFGLLTPVARLKVSWDAPLTAETSQRLRDFFGEHEEVIDLQAIPDRARNSFSRVPDLTQYGGIRFVVPLMIENRLFGMVALADPPMSVRLDWEDNSLMKLIARQAAGFIALRQAERSLAEADKLNGFSQMSAFLVHDVKTIASQLSLLLENAERHKANPAFVDDMLGTLANAVKRMRHLLEQLREEDGGQQERIQLRVLLESLLESFSSHTPRPVLECGSSDIWVRGNASDLSMAVGHLVQNAIDAASADGKVCVSLEPQGSWAEIHIRDSGKGMDEAFIRDTLFQPFTSTKGVAGMGIGAYQARACVRSFGGDLAVSSLPGRGSHFTIRLPVVKEHG